MRNPETIKEELRNVVERIRYYRVRFERARSPHRKKALETLLEELYKTQGRLVNELYASLGITRRNNEALVDNKGS